MICGLAGLIIWANQIAEKDRAAEAASPTCKSDWRKCSDNAEIADKHDGWFSARYDCERAAVKAAKYGDPKFPSRSFTTFLRGNDYVKTGVAVLFEDDAQFKNGFNATVNSSVRCTYDLKTKLVTDLQISSK